MFHLSGFYSLISIGLDLGTLPLTLGLPVYPLCEPTEQWAPRPLIWNPWIPITYHMHIIGASPESKRAHNKGPEENPYSRSQKLGIWPTSNPKTTEPNIP